MTPSPRATTSPGRAAALLVALAAPPAAAQQSVAPEAFLDLAQGRTLTFSDAEDGALVGEEHFLPGRRTVWVRADGTCALGRVTVRGPELCFEYDDDAPGEGPHCWWPLREGSALYVRLADARRDARQRITAITAITDEPLACAAVPSV